MYVPSQTKTEQRVITTLRAIIDKHNDMEHQFNELDKEMSWDGYIWLYKQGCDNHSKRNAIARVPVQIKGHNDPGKKYINKKSISYDVELDDLRLYGTEKGVLYFQIFICEDKRSVFYSSLFPSKIADYLEQAEKKNNKKSKKIPFFKLEDDADKLYNITLQFNSEAMKQGSAYNSLVENRIKIDEIPKIKEINMSVIGADNPIDAFKSLSSGDVCLYGKMEGDQFFRPIEWDDNAEYYYGNRYEKNITVNNVIYYRNYYAEINKYGNLKIKLSPNLFFEPAIHRFTFIPKSSMREIYNDANFLLALTKENLYYIGDKCVKYQSFELQSSFEEILHFIVDLHEILLEIDLEIDNPFNKIDEIKMDQLVYLINLKLGNITAIKEIGYHFINWKYGDKYYPLFVHHKEDSIELLSSVYADTLGIFAEAENGSPDITTRLPLFMVHKAGVLANLYCYKYNVLWDQIKNCEINKTTYKNLLNGLLVLISVFDINGDEQFLDMALYLIDRLEKYKNHEYLLINRLQIKKRRNPLNDEDIKCLTDINSEDILTLFGKYVLLGDKIAADSYFEQFAISIQNEYKEYPIYKLYCDL